MKYYVYISDAKVDMLYPQIPKSLLKKIASSLSIDLKLFGAELNVTGKSNPSDEMRYAKVQIVSDYIEKHRGVGSIDSPSTYFKGTMSMKWGIISNEFENMVYFTGHTDRTVVGLGGSPIHVIGGRTPKGDIDIPNPGTSSYPEIDRMITIRYQLLQEDSSGSQSQTPSEDELVSLWAAESMLTNLKAPYQKLEFLAKSFQQGSLTPMEGRLSAQSRYQYVVLGTPIYVAIAD